jgi:hypothetical protein
LEAATTKQKGHDEVEVATSAMFHLRCERDAADAEWFATLRAALKERCVFEVSIFVPLLTFLSHSSSSTPTRPLQRRLSH